MKHVRVRKHEDFQHYKDRTPPWIKLHRCCLSSYKFTAMPDAAKWHGLGIALLATDTGNHIPADPTWIAQKIGARSPVRLKPLIDSGFLTYCDCEQCASTSDSSTLATCTERRGEDTEDRGERKKEDTDGESEFDRFWKAYPKKRGKQRARAAFEKAKGNGLPPIDALCASIKEWSRTTDWTKAGGQYVPYPASWLNDHGWDDELPEPENLEWEIVRS